MHVLCKAAGRVALVRSIVKVPRYGVVLVISIPLDKSRDGLDGARMHALITLGSFVH